MTDPEQNELRRWLNRSIMGSVPHNDALGLVFGELGRDAACVTLPYAEHLVGNPETGVMHGSAVLTLMDACCGAAVFMSLDAPGPIATLDLRIDYLCPARPGEAVMGYAQCFKLTRQVAFVRGVAHHGDRSDPIASVAASFMLQTSASNRIPSSQGCASK